MTTMFYLLDDSDGCERWFISPDHKHIEYALISFPDYREVTENVYRAMQQKHLEEIEHRRAQKAPTP